MCEEKVAAIILAAGGSKRLGKPKQLLDWFGKPFINQIIDTVFESGLEPVVVVTGAYHQEVENRIRHKAIRITRNEQWEKGQSNSIIKGINELEKDGRKPFIIFLCDQPQVPIELIQQIVSVSQREKCDIVTASVNGNTCPPILFKPICISSLKELAGDQGGKAILKKFKTKTVDWKDDRLLLDSDTKEDYEKLINLFL